MARRKRLKPLPPPGSRKAGTGALARAVLFVAVVLVSTTDAGLFGINPDGRVMLRTAASLAELGELGIARGPEPTIDRPAGDSVTRYGVLPSVVLVPAYLLAGPCETAFGTGSSQVLFALHQILLLLAVASAAGWLARGLGGDDRAVTRAAFATVLASPLWAYASSDFSEPLQATLVVTAFSSAVTAVRPEASRTTAFRFALFSGATVGLALLSRSLLLLVVPCVAAILLTSKGEASRRTLATGALIGFTPSFAAWAALDLARFGTLLGGYGGERFSHSILDGFWRLVVGPNTGLVVFFPLCALGAWGIVRLARRGSVPAASAGAFCLALLATASGWWAWDGTLGWGPRLLLPCVPLLAAAGACEAGNCRPALFRTLFAAGLLVNGLGVLAPDAGVKAYLAVLPPRPVDEKTASGLPGFAYERDEAGRALVDPPYWAATEARLNPIRLSSWLLAQRIAGGHVAERLKVPPWDPSRPGLGPIRDLDEAVPADKAALLYSAFRWPWLGRSLGRGGDERGGNLAYLDALRDQANRAQDLGKAERAVEFSERLWRLVQSPETAVVLAESYRLAGRREALASLSDSLWRSGRPPDARLFVVLALLCRDLESDDEASALLARAVVSTRNEDIGRWGGVSPRSWPRTLREMTGALRRPREAALPARS